MPKFTTKPAFIWAEQWDGKLETYYKIINLPEYEGLNSHFHTICGKPPALKIRTFGADVPVQVGHWIIRDEAGDYLLCSPETFEATYLPI